MYELTIVKQDEGYDILLNAITAPYNTILKNAGYEDILNPKQYVEEHKDIEDDVTFVVIKLK